MFFRRMEMTRYPRPFIKDGLAVDTV